MICGDGYNLQAYFSLKYVYLSLSVGVVWCGVAAFFVHCTCIEFPRMSRGAENLVVTVKVNDVSFEVWVAGTMVTTFTHRAPWDTFTSVTVGPGCSTTRLTVDLLQLKDDPARPTLHTRVMADAEWYKDARGKLLEAVPCRDPEASAGSLISGSWVGTFVGEPTVTRVA